MSDLHRPRTFRLVRDEDPTGVSGTGTGMWASAAAYARSAARHAAHLHALTSAAAGCQPVDPPDQEVP